MNFIPCLILLCCLLLNVPISAQNQYIAQTHTLSITDGLLSNTINVIYEDSKGVVWIGTDYGLNSYDGINLLSYTKKENGLSGDFIRHISEDIHGNIWVSSSNQLRGNLLLNIIDPIHQQVQTLQEYCPTPDSFKNVETVRVIQNYDHTIWLVSKTNHIYEYNGERLVSLTDFNSSQLQQFFICKISPTELSFTTGTIENKLDTVILYNHKTNKIIEKKLIEKNSSIPHYTYSPKSSYWVSLTDSLFNIFSKSFKPVQVHKLKSTLTNSSFLKSTDDYIFIGDDKKVTIYDKEGNLQQTIFTGQELYFNRAIYIDKYNGIWYKDYQKESLRYIRYTSPPFKAYGLSEKSPNTIFRGGRGIIKLQDSLLFVGSVLPYPQKDLTPNLQLHSVNTSCFGVSKNSKNEFWIGKESGRATLIDSTGKPLLKSITLEHHNITWIVLEDRDQKVWAGMSQGLYYLDKSRKRFIPTTQYNEYPLLEQSTIFYIYEKGNLLYLCTSTGLYLWDKIKGAQACFLKAQAIAHLYEDKEGVFWLASKGGGLIKFDPKTKETQSFTTQDGLSHNVLYAVYEDDYNNLWMSSNWGIMRFDKSTKNVTNYVKENGLLENEFNTSSHYQDKEGLIYFGSQSGIVLFHPKDFQTIQDTFPFIITQASKFNSEAEADENVLPSLLAANRIELHPNDESFQLTAALLDYRNPKLHQYAYKIEGFNNNWRYQLNPLISINQLPYGDYHLKIKVKGISGNWVLFPQPIHILVYKPFYLQSWFILFALVAAIGLIIFIFKLRTKQLLERQRKLEQVINVRTKKIAQQTEDLKSLDQVKSRFFANISHELRTPLTLIIGPLSFLLDKIKRQEIAEKEVESSLLSIQKNSKHLLSLVEEILDLSKMENNKLNTYEETIHLKTYVQSIFESFVKQADYTGISYRLEEVLEDDLYVLLDENKVTKLLNNLLSNALKFTAANASVTFTVKEKNAVIEFAVQDTGSGIHPDDLPHIFERFYQSKQANRPAQGGTGIGLALVLEFTQLLQGKVTVDSTLNKGTLFKVLLPKNTIAPSPELLEQEKAMVEFAIDEVIETDTDLPNNSFTILLVEDHAEMRDFITQILSTKYRILIARNGLEGLEILKTTSDSIDLIISDVMMPKMDGFEMLQQIKTLPKWSYTPMIMLTARAAEQDKLQALTIGVDDYLTKPFSVEELKARIKNLLLNALRRKESLEEQQDLVLPNPTLEQLSSETPTEEQEISETTPNLREFDLAWVKEVGNLMLEEVDNELINISDFAQKLHLSERHLSRKLKQITGMSPAKMFKTVRLNLARNYLEAGTFKTVKEIAYATGFQTVGNFSKSYKKEYGKLPSTYFHTNTK
jgi:signal transduction histidine kinase/DNA-binding response OmpR family regulator/ligand-binding sensor domain-containing protein